MVPMTLSSCDGRRLSVAEEMRRARWTTTSGASRRTTSDAFGCRRSALTNRIRRSR